MAVTCAVVHLAHFGKRITAGQSHVTCVRGAFEPFAHALGNALTSTFALELPRGARCGRGQDHQVVNHRVAAIGVAAVAGIASYQHAYALVHVHGETGWTARLMPLTIDGLI